MTTFIQMANRGLREVNEVPLTSTSFVSPRGIQEYAKTAVNRAYYDIAGESTEWPWLHTTVSRVDGTVILPLTIGLQWYDFPANVLDVNWETFYITSKDPDVVDTTTPADDSENLIYIDYDSWVLLNRDTDNQRTTEQYAIPKYVIRHPNGKIGFSPAPDKAYFVEYFAYLAADAFTAEGDVLPFPTEFDNVMEHRLAYYMWKFRENLDQAALSNTDYNKSVEKMKRILLSNKSERMRAV